MDMKLLNIRSEMCRTDVTAVQIFNEYILLGVSNILHVFDIHTYKFHFKTTVLKEHRIHGIRLNAAKSELICFGNRELSIFSICPKDISLNNLISLNAGDWIWDIKCWNDEMVILTANNVIILWNWKLNTISKRIFNEEKCLLYCGLILGNEWDNNIIIGGSMFKTIVIWAPSKNLDNFSPCLHKLYDHKGAVFSISFNEKLSKLASTSDDRSVKLWRVDFPESSTSVVEAWSKANILPEITVYGHMSRVWNCIILDDGKFITAGEDSQLRIWSSNGTPICSWVTHQGASIRSLAVDQCKNIIITGGKDGAVDVRPLVSDNSSQVINTEEIHFSKAFKIDKIQDVPRKILLSRLNKLLTVTNAGIVFVYDQFSWKNIFFDVRFSSYCLFQMNNDRNLIGLSSIFGDVVVIMESGDGFYHVVFDEKIRDERIFSFHWLIADEFIICSTAGHLETWYFGKSSEMKPSWKRGRKFVLPKCKERWLTSAIRHDEFLVVGDRDGSVHLYHDQELNPIQTFSRVHGRLGVTFISSHTISKCISSVGRDGFIRYWKISDKKLLHVAADRLPLKWPAKVTNSDSLGTIVMGFNEINFEVWNINEKKKLLTIECGGGHRPWDFKFENDGKFAYIRGKILYYVTSLLRDMTVVSILEGNHIREIDCLRFLTKDIIISGSEDTTLRVICVNNGKLRSVATIRSHISSIKAIALCYENDYFFVASVGGRCEMKLWKIRVNEDLFEKRELDAIRTKDHNKLSSFDLEPRYMDVKLRLKGNLLYIYSARSNAFWRLDIYDTKLETMKIGSDVNYGSCCILKILPILWAGDEIVVTLGTDGKACFWNEKTTKLIHQRSIHNSGINSCDYEILDDVLLLATGGDDTIVKLSLFEYSSEAVIDLNCDRGVVHEAQVSSLKIFKNYVFSSGGDQKLVVWKWERNFKDVFINLISVYRTLIPDIHGLDLLVIRKNEVKVCVYGAGFEIINVTVK